MLRADAERAPIVFLSDFGLGNEWVGLCHAVMSGLAPQCPIVDLSHLVRPLEVASGAILLADAMPYISEDAVILGVVDPTVGKDREIAIETGERTPPRWPRQRAPVAGVAGGRRDSRSRRADRARRRAPPARPVVPRTGHALPATARLAAGLPIGELGAKLDPATLAVVTMAEPEIEPGKITCEVIDFNRFGNVHLNVRPAGPRGGFASTARSRWRSRPCPARPRRSEAHVRGLRGGGVRRALRPARAGSRSSAGTLRAPSTGSVSPSRLRSGWRAPATRAPTMIDSE